MKIVTMYLERRLVVLSFVFWGVSQVQCNDPEVRRVKSFDDSNLPIYLDNFTQVVSAVECRAHCGCAIGKEKAIFDGSKGCYCTDLPGTVCPDDNCFFEYKDLPKKGRLATYPAEMQTVLVNENVVLDVDNTDSYGIVVNGKTLKMGHGASATVEFFDIGVNILQIETDGFPVCRGEEYKWLVTPATDFYLSCPKGAIISTPFRCTVIITAGSSFKTLSGEINGLPTSILTSLQDVHMYEVGANFDIEPSGLATYDYSLGPMKAILIPNLEFSTDGSISMLKIVVSRPGCLKIMVLSPICYDLKHDPGLRKCKDPEFLPPVSGMYCPMIKQNTDSDECPKLFYNQQDRDFVVSKIFTYYANSTGYQVVPVSYYDEMVVKRSDIMGFVPCGINPGDIKFYEINIDDSGNVYPEYSYEVYDAVEGGSFSKANIIWTMHMLQAVVSTYVFYDTMPFNATQERNVMKAELVSNTSSKIVEATIIGQNTITGVSLTIDPAIFLANTPVTINLIAKGLEPLSPKFSIHFGEHHFDYITYDLTTNHTSINYTWPTVGDKKISLIAENLVSKTSYYDNVFVFGKINSIVEWEVMETVVPVNNPLQVALLIDGEGMANFSYSCSNTGSTTFIDVGSFIVDLSSFFILYIEKTHNEMLTLDCSFEVGHPLISKRLTRKYYIVEPITGFKVTQTLYKLTNQAFTLDPVFSNGSHIEFVYICDGWFNETHAGDKTKYITFTKSGIYTISLTIRNPLSEEFTNVTVHVQDPIEGLSFLDSFDTAYGTETNFTFTVTMGTTFNIHLSCYNIAGDWEIHSKTIYDNQVVSPWTMKWEGFFRHNISTPGYFNLTVTAASATTSQMITTLFLVELPVTFVHLDMFIGNQWIEVNDTLYFICQFNGGNPVPVIDFDDGRTAVLGERISSATPIIVHNFTHYSIPGYNVCLNVSNTVSHERFCLLVPVEIPVYYFKTMRLESNFTNSSDPLAMRLYVEQANLFTCYWSVEGRKFNTSYQDYLSGHLVYQLLPAGRYSIGIHCKNRLYSKRGNFSVYVFDPIKAFDILIFSECGDEYRPGVGFEQDFFNVNCTINFVYTPSGGTNLTWVTFFDNDERPSNIHRIPEYKTTFSLYKHEGSFVRKTVKIIGYNPTSKIEIKKHFTLVNPFNESFVAIVRSERPDNIVYINENLNILLLFRHLPYSPCIEIDFGDKDEKPFYSPLLIGGDHCLDNSNLFMPEHVNIVNIPLDQYVHAKTYVYLNIKTYKLILRAYNLVSEIFRYIYIQVKDVPCFPPEIHWLSALAKTNNATTMPFLQSCYDNELSLAIQEDCEKTTAFRISKWTLSLSNFGVPPLKLMAINTGKNNTLIISKRTLSTGIYRVHVETSMYDPQRGVFIEDTQSTLYGFFEVKRCSLRASIREGSGKTFQRNKTEYIHCDAYDPDKDPHENHFLKYTWYCSTPLQPLPKNLNMAEELYLPREKALSPPAKGCFDNRVGILRDKGQSSPRLPIPTEIMRGDSIYNFMVVITQAGREEGLVLHFESTLSYSRVVSVNLRCVFNCAEKKLPSEKISYVTVNLKHLFCRWELFSKSTEIIGDSLRNDTELLVEAAKTNIYVDKNMVIKPGYLDIDRVYALMLRCFWDPEKTSRAGSSQTDIKVNRPPGFIDANEGCTIIKSSGFALRTFFRGTCSMVFDGDTPITYQWKYKRLNSTDKWQLAALPAGFPDTEFLLTAGKETHNSSVVVKVTISDRFGASVDSNSIYLQVVKVSLNSNETNKLLLDSKSDYTLQNKLTTAFERNELTGVDLDAFLDEISAIMQSQPITDASTALSVSNSIRVLSTTASSITNKTRRNLLGTTQNIARYAKYLQPVALEKCTSDIFTSNTVIAGNLSSGEMATNVYSDVRNVETEMTMHIGSMMVEGEEIKVISTDDGDFEVTCSNSQSIFPDVKIPEDTMGSIPLPDNQCIGATRYSGKLRNTFEKTSALVSGEVRSLTLSTSGVVPINNLSTPIRLKIPDSPNNKAIEEHFPVYCELLRRVPTIECKHNESAILIRVKPIAEEDFSGHLFVFLTRENEPLLFDHTFNCSLPKENTLGENDDYFNKQLKWRCFASAQDLHHTCKAEWTVAVLHIPEGSPHPSHIRSLSSDVNTAKCKAVNVTFSATPKMCVYYDDSMGKWMTDGTKVSEATDDFETVCETSHLTEFGGGGPFVAPQVLDLAGSLSGFKNLGDNPTVFSVVLSILLLYVLLLLWARKRDKRDIEKSLIYPLPDNHPEDSFYYKISVQTGFCSGASTSASIFIILHGELGDTTPRRLHSSKINCFLMGSTNCFHMAVPYSLGDLHGVDIWHNNQGHSPGWFCMQVQVEDMKSHYKYRFVCNRWLAAAEEDGAILRELKVARNEDLVEFSFLFTQNVRKNLYDGHIWLSIFTRSPFNTFTRCQRLATCFSLLLTGMLANAMFYTGANRPYETTVNFGPFSISLYEIRVAFTSALIVIPCNLIIIALFKKAGPKNQKYIEEENNLERQEDTIQESYLHRKLRFLRSLVFSGREDDAVERYRKESRPLPYWLIYIAYFIALVTSLASAFFVTLYGFQFGKVKSDKWVVAMLLGFLQSVFIIQPIKVFVLSVFFSLVIKDPVKTEDSKALAGDDEGNLADTEKDVVSIAPSVYKLPDQRRLEEFRQMRMKEKRIKAIIKEIIVHLMSVALCFVVSFVAVDSASYKLAHSTNQMCSDATVAKSYHGQVAYAERTLRASQREVTAADQITNRLEWFDWARYAVIDYLFPDGWYNEKTEYPKGFVSDSASSKVLSMARFRQLRVRPMSCTKHPSFVHYIVECNAGYSHASEDTNDFSENWSPPFNTSVRLYRRKGKRKAWYLGLETPWKHSSAIELKNLPYHGQFAVYSGDSYAVSIGPFKSMAVRILDRLKKSFWLDRYTRAVFTEINMYNANVNQLLIVTYLHEVLPTGGWNLFSNTQALRLYRYSGSFGQFVMLFDVIFIFVTCAGAYKMSRACRRKGVRAYAQSTWNNIHAIITFFAFGAIIMTVSRILAVKWAIDEYTSDPDVFVSFAYVGQLEYLASACIGFVVLFKNLEFLRILRFNHRISLLTRTVSRAWKPLGSFLICFMILFMAYVTCAHRLLADKMQDYNSLLRSFVSLTKMFMGKFNIHELFVNAPILGPVLFFTYMVSIQMIFINLFVGLVCDAFSEVAEEEADEQAHVLTFLNKTVKGLGGKDEDNHDPIYLEWKSDSESIIENFTEVCDNCLYIMRNMEAEEVRVRSWFLPSNINLKKYNLLAAIIYMDYFVFEAELCDAVKIIDKKIDLLTDDQSLLIYKTARNMAFDRAVEQEDVFYLQKPANGFC